MPELAVFHQSCWQVRTNNIKMTNTNKNTNTKVTIHQKILVIDSDKVTGNFNKVKDLFLISVDRSDLFLAI